MGILRRLGLRRAAKQYARRLGPHLRRAYGAAEYYTAAQIGSAIAKLRLDPRYAAVGYAAFMPEDAYESLADHGSVAVPYHEARQLIWRFRPAGGLAANFYESGLGTAGGVDILSP